MKKLTYLIAIFIASILMLSSCTKGWEELNKDPNNPTEVPPTTVLGHVIRATGDAFFDEWQGMNNFLSYSGVITKIQYTDEARLNERESTINAAWANYYTLLEDLKKVQELADADPNDAYADNIKAVAKTFSVFLWIMATDQWGYIPFSEALKGEEGITNPIYDSQQDIYMALIDSLKDAYNMFGNLGGEIGNGDFLYGGDWEKWQKFAGSLLLRIAVRISYVDQTTARDILSEIDAGTYQVFESRDDEARLYWPGESPYYEPWYSNRALAGRDDHGMAKTFIDTLYNWQDPRIYAYAIPSGSGYNYGDDPFIYPITSDTIFKGQVEGSSTGDVSGTSRMGYLYRLKPDGYTWFMRYAEVLFNLADLHYRLNNDLATAQNFYEDGIDAAFAESAEDPVYGDSILNAKDAYIAGHKVAWDGAYSFGFIRGNDDPIDDNLVRIWVQRWIVCYKQGQEEWALMRLTDFPKMDVPPGSQYVGNHNRGPQRYPYPVDEENLNGANLQAAKDEQNISDDFWGSMWWDTRSGIE